MLLQATMSKPCEPDADIETQSLEAPNLLNSSSTSSSPLLAPSPANEISTSPSSTSNNAVHDSVQNQHRKPASGRVEVRLLVRRREAGALIGKRGANIKRLREIFAKSTFNIPDTGNGPERVVCIVADSLSSLEAILADISQLFLEKSCQLAKFQPNSARRNQEHDQIELKQLINSSHAGLLIGMGGQSIRKLRNDSKAAIKIYEMCCPNSNERVCAIKARPPVVVGAIKMIQEIVEASPAALKASIVYKPYDALNYDPSLVDKYGGYTPDDLGPRELMQLASVSGASTTVHTQARHQFTPANVHHLLSSNPDRLLYDKSTPPRTTHARQQSLMFPGALASHDQPPGLLPDGLGALLGALDRGAPPAAHLMHHHHAPLIMRELSGHRHAHLARFHPYLQSSPRLPQLQLASLANYPSRSKHHLQELLIAQHLHMLSAHQQHLLSTPTNCSCCSHAQHDYPKQQPQLENPVSSSCSCASTSCETDIDKQMADGQSRRHTGGGCPQPPPPPPPPTSSDTHDDKQTTERGPLPG